MMWEFFGYIFENDLSMLFLIKVFEKADYLTNLVKKMVL